MGTYWAQHPYYANQYPYYNGHNGQLYAPPPQFPAYHGPVMPGVTTVPLAASSKWQRLNTLLSSGETLVRFDVRKKPRETILTNTYEIYGLQPALITNTHVKHIRLYSKTVPWCIEIMAKEQRPITCRDVWEAVHDALQQELDDSEWGMIVRDKKLRETVEKAAKKRESTKLKRIDFLGEGTMFKGLEKDEELTKVRLLPGSESCAETWVAIFGS